MLPFKDNLPHERIPLVVLATVEVPAALLLGAWTAAPLYLGLAG